ncbi:1,5-anhydro-D-fructose reductase [Anaerohalosphaera lusitana]|uniref:1,5-anhydro-D-fructose reductase n=1 Tax=Anaerohalosphaera lusitana TaxID=1936003 RepID=A0A1U9NNF0_9BACT|nr:Gfo/Idh/MocA family oxidoreductase [Anaerohalosphaera lusitana]AQT69355.1 1,5-anhydro-D-fructose reductase [Anaerohalosphaera lusitana]
MKSVRWGILATGQIARKFAEGLQALPDAELVAVGSRKLETAKAFAEEYNIPRAYGSYAELTGDPDIDVVYIATPHPAHAQNTLQCIDAGKAVLCEKPFALNATQARHMIQAAAEKNIFLMEAMWTRYIPLMLEIENILEQGTIGPPKMIHADFGYSGDWEPDGRVLSPHLAGGALLDVGIYAISLASMVYQRDPEKVAALAHMASTGVDEISAFILSYEPAALAILSCAVGASTPGEATISGSKGYIKIHSPFWCPSKATVSIDEGKTETIEVPFEGNGYNYEAAEVHRCLREGLTQSPKMPLEETLRIMGTMDNIRKQWNLKYPMEHTL